MLVRSAMRQPLQLRFRLCLMFGAWDLGARSCLTAARPAASRRGEPQSELGGYLSTDLLGNDARLNFLDGAGFQIAKGERAKRETNETRHVEIERR